MENKKGRKRSQKKWEQRRRQNKKTHEEMKQIKFPKNDPGFVYQKISDENASKDQIINDLRDIKASKAMKDLLERANRKYMPCEDLEDRYGQILYYFLHDPSFKSGLSCETKIRYFLNLRACSGISSLTVIAFFGTTFRYFLIR